MIDFDDAFELASLGHALRRPTWPEGAILRRYPLQPCGYLVNATTDRPLTLDDYNSDDWIDLGRLQ